MIRSSLLCLLFVVPTGCEPSSAGSEGTSNTSAVSSDNPTVLVTGSNRGLGLEFARAYAAKGWNVIATARKPESADDLQALAADNTMVVVERLDVTDDAQIAALADKYRGKPIDVLINNAGVRGSLEEQALGSLSREGFEKIMAVNAFGPLRISEAFLDHVASSDQKKVVVITTRASSMAKARGRKGLFYYQMSKAAINMGMIAFFGHTKNRGLKVGIFSPGQVDTDMWRMDGNELPAQPPAEAAAKVMVLIENLTQKNSAKFFQNDGSVIPW